MAAERVPAVPRLEPGCCDRHVHPGGEAFSEGSSTWREEKLVLPEMPKVSEMGRETRQRFC